MQTLITSWSTRFRIARVSAIVAALAGTTAVLAATAWAQEPIRAYVTGWVQTGAGASSDFSYTGLDVQMARNIEVSAPLFAPGTTVRFSWRATTSSRWTAGPTVSVPSQSQLTAYITGIPQSMCEHSVEIEARGQTGVWNDEGEPDYTVLHGASAKTAVFDDCGPKVWLTATGIAGDGFTAGGAVDVQTFSPTGAQLTSQTTTASAETWTTRCASHFQGGPTCVSVPVGSPGQIGVTNALNAAGACNDDSYQGTDLTTDTSDVERDLCAPFE